MKANSLSDKQGELWLNTKDRPKICALRAPQTIHRAVFFPILWLNLNQSSDLIWSFDPLAESILNLVLWLDVNFDPRAGYGFNLLARSSSIFWLDLLRFDSLAESISFDSLADLTSIFWLDLDYFDDKFPSLGSRIWGMRWLTLFWNLLPELRGFDPNLFQDGT